MCQRDLEIGFGLRVAWPGLGALGFFPKMPTLGLGHVRCWLRPAGPSPCRSGQPQAERLGAAGGGPPGDGPCLFTCHCGDGSSSPGSGGATVKGHSGCQRLARHGVGYCSESRGAADV